MSPRIARIADLIRERAGISLHPGQERFLHGALGRAFPDSPDPDTFLRRAEDPDHGSETIQRLVEQVTIHETSFFREPRQLEQIEWHAHAARALARGDGAIRVWCAACATGEEAYTVAMLAWEAFGSSVPPVRIVATDISAAALGRAREGRYAGRTLRSVDPAIRERYFTQEGDAAVVSDRVKRLVEFTSLNLASDSLAAAGRYDVILCRNVLIYFEPETVARVLRSLEGVLHQDGQLILGSADTLAVTSERLAHPPLAPALPPERERPPTRAEQPHDVAADLFARAVLELNAGRTEAARTTLAEALAADPSFGLAAFQLARLHEAGGDPGAARREYARSLRLLEQNGSTRYDRLLGQLHVADIAAACHTRLAALRRQH